MSFFVEAVFDLFNGMQYDVFDFWKTTWWLQASNEETAELLASIQKKAAQLNELASLTTPQKMVKIWIEELLYKNSLIRFFLPKHGFILELATFCIDSISNLAWKDHGDDLGFLPTNERLSESRRVILRTSSVAIKTSIMRNVYRFHAIEICQSGCLERRRTSMWVWNVGRWDMGEVCQ